MRQFLFLILFLSNLNIIGQTFGDINTSGYETLKDIEKELDKQILKAYDKKEISNSIKKIIGDTLVYSINHKTDPFTVTAVFNIEDSISGDKYCGFQEYNFDCTPCSQKHSKDFIRIWKFREQSPNIYLSQYFLKSKMIVTYKSDNKDCIIVTFIHIEMSKKKYKELYKSLKKTI